LMGQLLGLAVPDNELTASLDAQLRKQRLFDITLTLLRHQARQSPLFLIVFEDVQWIDAISLEMLNYVARNIAHHRILLVALHRPTVELAQWKQYDYYHQIELTDLTAQDALELVKLKLGMRAVPAPLQAQVLRGETQVNPFFVEEVINSLIDQGYLVPREQGEGYVLTGDLSRVEIPDSVHALVMSRIDRLDESSRLTIKVASVVGRTFRYQTLQKTYPVQILPRRLRENLDKLDRLDLTPLAKPAPDWEYVFKQIMTQDVAYESLLYAHRRELHHRLGEYLEQAYHDNLEEYYELLAHHYFQSGDQEKSWVYLVKAGDKARDQYANDAAIVHYYQALSLDVHQVEKWPVYESLGDIYHLIGQYERALEHYQEALDHHPPTAVQVAEIWRKTAKTWELQGQYDGAMRYLDLIRATLGAEKSAEMARVYNDMGWIAMLRGDYDKALQLCDQGLDTAEHLADDEKSHLVKDELQHTLGTVYLRTGAYDQAISHFQKCIEIREKSGNIYGMGRSYLNLAVAYWSQSDYEPAARYIRESLDIFRKIGYAHATAMCYNNLGAIHYTLGDYAHAVEQYEKSLEIRKEIGDVQGIAAVYTNLGEAQHRLENRPQAIQHLQEAVRLSTEIGDRPILADAHKSLAEVEMERGNLDEALGHCQRSLEIAQEIGNREYEGIAYRVLGQIHRAAGHPQAIQCLQNSVEILSATGNKLELGRSHYELGLTLSSTDAQKSQEQLQQAVQIFEALGVQAELEKAQAALDKDMRIH
jgi:tetratricopeptide (TPR) repeat protein